MSITEFRQVRGRCCERGRHVLPELIKGDPTQDRERVELEEQLLHLTRVHDDHVEAGTRASNQIFGHRSVHRIDCAAVNTERHAHATPPDLREDDGAGEQRAGCLSDNSLENIVNLSQLPLEDFSRIASESSIEDEAMQAVTHPSTASGRAAKLRARSASRRGISYAAIARAAGVSRERARHRYAGRSVRASARHKPWTSLDSGGLRAGESTPLPDGQNPAREAGFSPS